MVAGMRALGFETLLKDRWLSPIIVTFFCPADPAFVFTRFYDLMKAKGFIIYPGKLTVVDSFRIGVIGRMDEHVMRRVVQAAKECLDRTRRHLCRPSRPGPCRTRQTCRLKE